MFYFEFGNKFFLVSVARREDIYQLTILNLHCAVVVYNPSIIYLQTLIFQMVISLMSKICQKAETDEPVSVLT